MNNKRLLSYEEFEKQIKDIQRLIEFEDNLRGLVNSYRNGTKELLEITFPSLIRNTISLLSIIMEDEWGWIDYWVYELDCGKKYYDGCVKEADKKNISLKTIEDLWNLLTKQEAKNLDIEEIKKFKQEVIIEMIAMGASLEELSLLHDETARNAIRNNRNPKEVATAILQ